METDYSDGRSFLDAMDRLSILMRRIKISGGMPKGVFGILMVVDHHHLRTGEKHVRLGELCALLHRPMPSITRSVNALEEDGYVERTMSKTDRRAVYVSLTKHGQEAVDKSAEAMFGVLDRVFEQMGPADTKELLRLVTKMGDILNTIGENEEC